MSRRDTMAAVRRNDPCPCGSGLKFKKCCGSDADRARLEQEMDREIGRAVSGFFEEHPTPSEMQALSERRREYGAELEQLHGEEAAAIIGDLYFFRDSVETWNAYVQRKAGRENREALRDIIRGFEDPLFLALLVAGVSDGQARVHDLVSAENYGLRIDGTVRASAGDVLIGFFLRDAREDGRILPLNSLVHAEGADAGAMRKLKEQADGRTDSQAFFAEHPLAAYRLFGQGDGQPVAVTDAVTDASDRLERFMIDHDLKDDRLLEAFFHFLGQAGSVPEEAVAGAVWHGIGTGSFGLGWTLSETAEAFGADPESVSAFAESLSAFIARAEELDEDGPEPVYAFGVGTDPIATEFENWNLFMHLKEAEVPDEKALRRLMEAYDGQPYMPKSAAEEAQIRAYEAYLAKEADVRSEKAREALALDPSNPDALLLAGEGAEDEEERTELFRKAAASGKELFEPGMDVPWGYVPNRSYLRARFRLAVHLWDQNRMEEAFEELYALLRLNPGDHQGARYVALSALLSLGRFDEAESLIAHYEEPEADNALYAWFRWAAERRKSLLSPGTEAAYRIAEDQNPYVVKYVRDRPEADPYPKSAAISPRSPEEARLIWTLIGKTL